MKLTEVDPFALRAWANEAYEESVADGTVELHVTATTWELRATGVAPFVMEPQS